MDLIANLNWRYATKKYSDRKVPQEKLDAIIEAINLSPSSAGMQPYRLVVIEDPELRKQLGADSFNQQISTASHLLVFAAYTAVRKEHIEDYIRHIAQVRGVEEESLGDFKRSLESYLLNTTDEQNFVWASRQAYIALGTGILAAAELKVDATHMEGFNADKFDEILGLKDKGLKSVVLLALGYRDEENDPFARMKKVRLPKAEFAMEI